MAAEILVMSVTFGESHVSHVRRKAHMAEAVEHVWWIRKQNLKCMVFRWLGPFPTHDSDLGQKSAFLGFWDRTFGRKRQQIPGKV